MGEMTDPQILEKWRRADKVVIFYDEWGYYCCGEQICIGDTIENYFVSEWDKPIGGADLYFDGHCNIGFSRSSSFCIDGIVERIQVMKRSDKIPEGVLFDLPDTDAQAPIDPETFYDGWVTDGFLLTVKPTSVYFLDE